MSVETALVTHLKTVGAITAIVGAGTAARIEPWERLQDSALPAITYQLIDDVYTSDWSTQTHLNPVSRLQINCWAATREAARSLRLLCITAMNSFSGTISGTSIDSARVQSGRASFERVGNDKYWSYSFDVLVAHSA